MATREEPEPISLHGGRMNPADQGEGGALAPAEAVRDSGAPGADPAPLDFSAAEHPNRHFTEAEAQAFLDLAELHGLRAEVEELVRSNLQGALTISGARTRLIVLAGGETLGEMPPPPEPRSAIEHQPSPKNDQSSQPKGKAQIEPLR